MGVRPFVFNGATIYRPGYYTKRNIEAGGKAGDVSLNTVIIIGSSEGGVPYNAAGLSDNDKIMFFSGTQGLRTTMRRGDNVEAGRLAFDATNDPRINAGANELGFIRVDPATQSVLALENGGSNTVINLKSVGYGTYTKGIAVNVSPGVGGQLAQVRADGETISQNGLAYEPFTIQYVGSNANALLTITETQLSIAAGGADDITVDLVANPTLQQVVDAIETNSNYVVALDPSFAGFNSKYLDNLSGQDVKPSVFQVTANVQALIDWFNITGLVTAEIADEAERTDVANLADFTFLTAGANGTVTNADWANALDLALQQDAFYIGVMSDDSSIHALLSSHLAQANSVKGRKERRGATGCGLSDDDNTRRSKAQIIGSQFCAFYGSNDYRFDVDGNEVLMPGYIISAGLLGMSSGNEVIEPLTHKSINIIRPEKTWEDTEIENFIQAGVIIPTQVENGGGWRIERSVTTFQGSNLIANEWSIMGVVLAITKEHRIKVEARFVGRPGTTFATQQVESYSLELLDEFQERGWFVGNSEIGEAGYSNHVVEVEGDVFKITYDGIVPAPINFVAATHNFTLQGLGR